MLPHGSMHARDALGHHLRESELAAGLLHLPPQRQRAGWLCVPRAGLLLLPELALRPRPSLEKARVDNKARRMTQFGAPEAGRLC